MIKITIMILEDQDEDELSATAVVHLPRICSKIAAGEKEGDFEDGHWMVEQF